MKKIIFFVSLSIALMANSMETEAYNNENGLMLEEGKKIYNRCAICHGVKGQREALGKSAKISDLSEEDINKALLGYRNGTYGGGLKAVMKGQVKDLNEVQLKSVAAYIASIKD